MLEARIFRNIKLGIKSLLLHKLRSALTMLGVVFGVGSVVAMLSVGEGASREALRQIEKLGSNNIILTSMKPQADEASQQNVQRSSSLDYGMTYEDLDRIAMSFPAVRRVVPAKIVRKEARLGAQGADVRIVGTTGDWFDLVPRELIAGRLLTAEDVATKAPVVVLAERAARTLLATRNTVGQPIRIGGDAYEVVGIIRNETVLAVAEVEGSGGGGVGAASGSSAQLPDTPIDAYMPISVVRERVGDTVTNRSSGSFSRERVELHQILVEVGEYRELPAIEHVEATADGINAMLMRFHAKVDYEMQVPLSLLNQARETQRIFSIVLGSIAGISLLVGGIGIMNIMLASVTERTREIGVRRAIGAKRRQIIGQFLIETVVLSLAGGLIGVGMGVAIPFFITQFANMPTEVTSWSVLLSLGISAAVGIIFGLYPAYRAAMLDPIIALRHE